MIKTLELLPGITLRCFPDSRFKQGCLSFSVVRPMCHEEAAVNALADTLAFERRGIRILRLEKGYQMVSSGEMADYITKALETRKPPKLSASQLETLTMPLKKFKK